MVDFGKEIGESNSYVKFVRSGMINDYYVKSHQVQT